MVDLAGLTMGAEEELHLIDQRTRRLVARAPQVLTRLSDGGYAAELQRSTIETNTDVVSSLGDLRAELLRLRGKLVDVIEPDGLGVAAVGTAPLAGYTDLELSATGRFGHMHEQYRLLVDEQLICSTQIHVGVPTRDLAVDVAQRVGWTLPVLIALSASSPFWNGADTGYASFRTILWDRWPSAGPTGPLKDAREYDELLADLIASGVIADDGMAYFDVRPSAHVPTIEMRVADACPVVDDAVLIAGLFRGAVHHALADIEAGHPHVTVREPLRRAAIWQAARGGLSGTLFDSTTHPRPAPAARAVRDMVARLRPDLEALGDYEEVVDLTEQVLARGNSADRQRAAFAERRNLEDVVDLVLHETRGSAQGSPPDIPSLPGYRARAGDEAIGPASRPRPAYRGVIEHFRGLGDEELLARQEARDEWTRRTGLVFRVDGEERPFDIDLVPRIISAPEWAELSAGVAQRARALEMFLQDVYGERRVVADGVLSDEVITSSDGYRAEAERLPAGTVHGTVMGFDLVRNEVGEWRVLEDNVRVPSGSAYAMAARDLTDTVLPDLPRPEGMLDPTSALAQLRSVLLAHVDGEGTAALLSSGPENSAWFEHRALAKGAELLLLTADDVEIVDDVVRERATGTRIDSLYVRLDEDLQDLTDGEGTPVGARIFEAAAAGHVLLANAPGNGIADDKAVYCLLPELIVYYLEQSPLLASVPTYRPGNEAERAVVLERVPHLVTKPVNGAGGAGVLVGPYASAAEVEDRRRAIEAAPAAWIAQEVVSLSSHPTFAGTELEPRHVDLRMFVFVAGTGPDDCVVADVALSRMAKAGTMVVNSSKGGGAKDTWIVAD